MITINKEELFVITFLTLTIFALIIIFIKEYLEGKLEDEKDNWIKHQNDMNIKSEAHYRSCLESHYKQQFEWWKRDYLAKKLDRISIRLTGNETMTIDYIDIQKNDKFLVIRDKDFNQILINTDFIREVRYYDAGNTRGSSEDDKG